jgi:hypothetical protein
MKPPQGARDKGLQSLLVMTSLYTSWMILPLLFQKFLHLQMQTTGRKWLIHVKCIHDLCTLPLDIPSYLHHILVIFMLFDDYCE